MPLVKSTYVADKIIIKTTKSNFTQQYPGNLWLQCYRSLVVVKHLTLGVSMACTLTYKFGALTSLANIIVYISSEQKLVNLAKKKSSD